MAIDDQRQVDAATTRPETDDTDETVMAKTFEEIAMTGLHVQVDTADVDSVIGNEIPDVDFTAKISRPSSERSPARRATSPSPQTTMKTKFREKPKQ